MTDTTNTNAVQLDKTISRLLDTTIPRATSAALSSITKDAREAASKNKSVFDDLGRSLRSSLESALGAAANSVLKQAVSQPLQQGISGLLGSGLSGLFGGARAGGGMVAPGRAFLVGEKGPELFSPSGAGSIVPNGALAGGGGAVINVNISTPDAGSFLQSRAQVQAALAGAVRQGSLKL
jgi:phage-related minor tail protein